MNYLESAVGGSGKSSPGTSGICRISQPWLNSCGHKPCMTLDANTLGSRNYGTIVCIVSYKVHIHQR